MSAERIDVEVVDGIGFVTFPTATGTIPECAACGVLVGDRTRHAADHRNREAWERLTLDALRLCADNDRALFALLQNMRAELDGVSLASIAALEQIIREGWPER